MRGPGCTKGIDRRRQTDGNTNKHIQNMVNLLIGQVYDYNRLNHDYNYNHNYDCNHYLNQNFSKLGDESIIRLDRHSQRFFSPKKKGRGVELIELCHRGTHQRETRKLKRGYKTAKVLITTPSESSYSFCSFWAPTSQGMMTYGAIMAEDPPTFQPFILLHLIPSRAPQRLQPTLLQLLLFCSVNRVHTKSLLL